MTMARDVLAPDSLPAQINAETRSVHAALNRLITARLPLCLPPYTTSDTLYTTGLLHFAHVYLTFESLWADLLPNASQTPSSPLLSFLLVDPWEGDHSSDPRYPSPRPAMLDFLRDLRPRGLVRSGRLKRDLELLTGFHGTDLSVLLSQFPAQRVQEYCSHIRRAVAEKPHVLVAYAWCYYMAIFSGGRWIRGELLKAGEEFWQGTEGVDGKKLRAPPSPEEQGLALWFFDGDSDGEDIKAEFKKRLSTAEELFTEEERRDVVEEAGEIFRFSVGLVRELDEKLGTDVEQFASAGKREMDVGKEESGKVRPMTLGQLGLWLCRPEVAGGVAVVGFVAVMAFSGFDPKNLL